MSIEHSPKLDLREQTEGDLETFHSLEQGDRVTFFEWSVESLTVIGREEDQLGERVRVKAAGGEPFLYEVVRYLWHYSDVGVGVANTYLVQNLVKVGS